MIDENKLIDELNKKSKEFDQEYGHFLNKCEFQEAYRCAGKTLGIIAAMEIVKEQERIDVPFAYVNKWIPASERLPEEYGSYLVAWKTIPMIDRTHTHFYEILEFDPDDEALWTGIIRQANGLEYEIIAWMPLPKPYMQADHETKNRTNADRIRSMTDEELADLFERFGTFNQPCNLSKGKPFEWLQSEVEE